jgi:hypothetical protein
LHYVNEYDHIGVKYNVKRSLVTNVVRFVPPIGEPLGLEFRPGPQDQRVLPQLMSEGRTSFNGLVLDPTAAEGAHKELREEANRRFLETVLDPRFMELATPVGFTETRATRLKWAGARQHTIDNLSGTSGKDKIAHLADFVMELGFSSVIAPTHFIQGANDPWFGTDQRLTEDLRLALDRRGGREVTLQYALALPGATFADATQRDEITDALRELPLDAVRLRIHPFGNDSGHVSLLRYIQSSRELVSLGVPIIAERTGNIGLALLAFGAVSGLESGVTFGDKFDIGALRRAPSQSGFVAPRVYVAELGLFVPKTAAHRLLRDPRLRGLVVCHNSTCCARGEDMVSQSRRHFVVSRMAEIAALNRPPAQQRPIEYLERMLRPATDRMARVLQVEIHDAKLKTKFENERGKQAGWRFTLGELAAQPLLTVPRTPTRRATRQAQGRLSGR